MTEYIPCFLIREIDTSAIYCKVECYGPGFVSYSQHTGYKERLIPVEMSEMVALVQGKKVLRQGPFKMPELPVWASKWFKKRHEDMH